MRIPWGSANHDFFPAYKLMLLPQRAGQPFNEPVTPRAQGYADNKFSFRTPPEDYETKPTFIPALLSAPVGQRGILAEVRAAPPNRPVRRRPPQARQNTSQRASLLSHSSHSSRLSYSQTESEFEQTPTATTVPIPLATPARKTGTMTRGNMLGRSAKMDQLMWLSSVRRAEKTKEGSSGTGSGANSGNASRVGSRSRPPSREPSMGRGGKRSVSRGKWDEGEMEQTLQEE